MSRKKINQGFLLQSRSEILSGNFAIPVFADSVSFFDKVKPVFLLWSDFVWGFHGDHRATKARCKTIAFGRDTQVDPVTLVNAAVEGRANQIMVSCIGAHH